MARTLGVAVSIRHQGVTEMVLNGIHASHLSQADFI